MAPTTKTKTSGVKKKTKARVSKKKGLAGSTLLSSLPEAMEHIEIVQHIAGVLDELKGRVHEVKEEAGKELKKILKAYETKCQGLEKKVHDVALKARKQAQTGMIQLVQKWHEHKEKLPKPLTKEIDKIVEQIGNRVVSRYDGRKPSVSSSSMKKTKVGQAVKKSYKKAPKTKIDRDLTPKDEP